eukprot:CAMPEP_0205826830 /NCGR_PEP_ID=MMETSP0206-20130828/30011_1 /ASSEMBLY_ACC=CAM_ASM_000279 /TAXON_ID=36767 /ORGANISM="Euplotes focardii, Strain TN1" /LENGTH=74 /DNA_ID=CAMNT_0053127115 /DNA_START=550 /DNA_END=771 /DNA_ORIENTATION=+
MNISDRQLEEMSDWSTDKQFRMVRSIMRKTADNEDISYFELEIKITEVCRNDDFYQTFGYDEEDVRAYVDIKNE